MLTSPRTEEEFRRAEEAPVAMNRYLANLVARVKPHVGSDLAEEDQPSLLHGLLAASEDQDRLSDGELLEMQQLQLLLIAGHETTVNLIGSLAHDGSTWAWSCPASRPPAASNLPPGGTRCSRIGSVSHPLPK